MLSARIGPVFGIPIKLHYTLVIAVFLTAGTLAAGLMPSEHPGLSVTGYRTIGVIGVIALFVSVLGQELAHSYVTVKNGPSINRIVLLIFGGGLRTRMRVCD